MSHQNFQLKSIIIYAELVMYRVMKIQDINLQYSSWQGLWSQDPTDIPSCSHNCRKIDGLLRTHYRPHKTNIWIEICFQPYIAQLLFDFPYSLKIRIPIHCISWGKKIVFWLELKHENGELYIIRILQLKWKENSPHPLLESKSTR